MFENRGLTDVFRAICFALCVCVIGFYAELIKLFALRTVLKQKSRTGIPMRDLYIAVD